MVTPCLPSSRQSARGTSLSCGVGVVLALLLPGVAAEIRTLDQLTAALNAGGNKKVGFIAQANYDSVHTILPDDVEVVLCDGAVHYGVICHGQPDLVDLIVNETLLGGLLSGLPSQQQIDSLHTFPSQVVSTKAMLMAPAYSVDTPHGTTDPSRSSYDLSLAVDASIVTLQQAGKDEEIRAANMPFEFLSLHTCNGNDISSFRVPNYGSATGLLRATLDNKTLLVGALGPYDWGGNDGNYLLTPYKGFYVDWLTEFCRQFNALKGPDGVRYDSAGTINCTRVWQLSSTKVFRNLFDGKAYVTEPYYLLDAFYTGTGEECATFSDCRPAVTQSGHESCAALACTLPSSPRIRHFRASCSTFGVDANFLTKRYNVVASPSKAKLATGIIVLLVVLGVLVLCLCTCACIMVCRERSGKPLFNPLNEAPQTSRGQETGA